MRGAVLIDNVNELFTFTLIFVWSARSACASFNRATSFFSRLLVCADGAELARHLITPSGLFPKVGSAK